MAFDPITLAMAKPKVIDLDSYGSSNQPLGTAILYQAISGGGSVTIDNSGTFWDDVSAGEQIALKMRYNGNMQFNIGGLVTLRNTDTNTVVQVSFTVLLYRAETNTLMDIKVSLSFTGANSAGEKGIAVNVKVS